MQMSIIRFLGDVHGKFQPYKTILKNSPHPTIQIGDMGIGFRKWPHGEPSANPPYDAMVAGGHKFIRGNHDNPAVCKRHTQYIADGTIIDNMMFIGGALSIDKAYRVEGFSYWSDEELSTQELDQMIDIYIATKPEIMITHETPESIAELMVGTVDPRTKMFSPGKLDPRFASRTRQAFQSMFELYQPKLWIYGHWHIPFDEAINGTRFICLPELATIDIDMEGWQSGNAAVC